MTSIVDDFHARNRIPIMKLVSIVALMALAACNQQADRVASSAQAGDGPQAAPTATASALPVMTVYKSPTCGCCKSWVDAVKQAGFTVEVHDVADVTPVKDEAGVPADKRSCHTAIVGGYAIEGHVPPATIKKFLAEHPKAAGLAVPGMPTGAPGMEMPGMQPDHYDVIAFQSNGASTGYESH
jgi:hypothetical protein